MREVEGWMERGERKKRRRMKKAGEKREEEPVTHKTMDD